MELDYRTALDDIIEWDVKSWRIALDYWLKESSLSIMDSSALELGSRNGGLSLWLAMQGCHVVCSDLTGPTEKARSIHSNYGISDFIQYSNVDATSIPYNDESFDIVTFKSILGGIGYNDNKEAQIRAINEIYRVLKPGGELLFAENLISSPLHKALRKRFVNWGATWRYPSIDEINEFLCNFSYVKHLTTGFLAAFGRSEAQRKILASVDSIFTNRIIPDKWRYIVIGIAKK